MLTLRALGENLTLGFPSPARAARRRRRQDRLRRRSFPHPRSRFSPRASSSARKKRQAGSSRQTFRPSPSPSPSSSVSWTSPVGQSPSPRPRPRVASESVVNLRRRFLESAALLRRRLRLRRGLRLRRPFPRRGLRGGHPVARRARCDELPSRRRAFLRADAHLAVTNEARWFRERLTRVSHVKCRRFFFIKLARRESHDTATLSPLVATVRSAKASVLPTRTACAPLEHPRLSRPSGSNARASLSLSHPRSVRARPEVSRRTRHSHLSIRPRQPPSRRKKRRWLTDGRERWWCSVRRAWTCSCSPSACRVPGSPCWRRRTSCCRAARAPTRRTPAPWRARRKTRLQTHTKTKKINVQTEFVGAVGADAFGEQLRRAFLDANVGVDGLAIHSSLPTACAAVIVDVTGENQIAVGSGANGRRGRLATASA